MIDCDINYNNHDFLKYDLHIHSRFSYDSLSTPKRILKAAKHLGLSGLAITDHNTIKGAIEVSKIDKIFQIIIGSEIKTDKGDIIGLFLNDEIISRRFDEVVDEIRDQDGFIVLPHPYKTHNDVPVDILDKIDAIEIFNGRISPELNKKAGQLKYKKLLFTGGSDAHLVKHVGSVVTIIDKDSGPLTIDNIHSALKKVEIKGMVVPRYTHYYTAAVGNIRMKRYTKLGKLAVNEFYKLVAR
ncbi:MAG: PHP domain-containing protein [Methanosarcinales archaeon]|nr:PHP domain-containing protein [Methanosarcinales archaeon]